MNVCIFGDSVTKGVVFDEVKQKYVVLKENFISLIHEKSGIEFKNFSSFGCTSDKGKKVMHRKISDLSNFKYTLIEFGGNDCDYNWSEIATTPLMAHDSKVPLDRYKASLMDMIEETIQCGSEPVLVTLPPIDSQRFFNWISKGLDKEKILKFLNNDIETIYRWHEMYSNAIVEVANDYSLKLIDIRSEFITKRDYKSYLCIDGMHPNKLGHELIASFMNSQLAIL